MKPRIDRTAFDSITIEGTDLAHDVIILLNGRSEKRKKKLSKAIYGTSHIISLAEAEHVFEKEARRLIVGAGQSGLVKLSDEVELFLTGRAACQLKEFYRAYPAGDFFGQPCQSSFLREWHNHFDNYGNLMPGYCGGISLGHWKNLTSL